MFRKSKKQTNHLRKIKRLQNICIDKNLTTEHDIFFRLAGHTNCIIIDVHIGGWIKPDLQTKEEVTFEIALDVAKNPSEIKYNIDRCLAFLEGLR